MRTRLLPRSVGVFAAAVFLVSGAGSVAVPAASRSPLTAITVSGAPSAKPTLEFDAPFSVTASKSKELTTGSGAPLATGNQVTVDYVVVNGRNGAEIETTYGAAPVTIGLDKKSAPAGLVDGLEGSAVGARVLVALAPKEGLTGQLKSAGVKKNDTLVFVFDVRSARVPLQRAMGAAVEPVSGLPTVKLAKSGKPKVTVPATDPPSALVAQQLIRGTGPVVVAGQTIRVHYTGVVWADGKQFDSSWDRRAPVDFPIGEGSVIAGWDQGLVGTTVGSQILLVIPPALGYGTEGNANAGIKGTDTLVFVVDVLDAS